MTRAIWLSLVCALFFALVAARADAAQLALEPWPLPITQGAQPNLTTEGKQLWLSWIERDGDAHRLRMARFDGQRFQHTHEVARGKNWFVNWADFPGVVALPDGDLVAFWLARQGEGTYAYGVRAVRSQDDGAHWSESIVPHDASPTEHGFVSLWPWSRHELALAWLDGRRTGGAHDHEQQQPAGAMSLRGAVFDRTWRQREDWELDARTCDCCQTDAALTADGPIVVYRDRSDNDVRDIHALRYRDGHWTEPAPVHRDDWTIAGCPVNGPAVAARSQRVVVGWYTAAQNQPKVLLAQSHDSGAHFDTPRTVVAADALGRVDLAIASDQRVWVLWMTENASGQALWLGVFDRELNEIARTTVRALPRGRATGFPRLALLGETAHLVWTDVVDGTTRVVGTRARLNR